MTGHPLADGEEDDKEEEDVEAVSDKEEEEEEGELDHAKYILAVE